MADLTEWLVIRMRNAHWLETLTLRGLFEGGVVTPPVMPPSTTSVHCRVNSVYDVDRSNSSEIPIGMHSVVNAASGVTRAVARSLKFEFAEGIAQGRYCHDINKSLAGLGSHHSETSLDHIPYLIKRKRVWELPRTFNPSWLPVIYSWSNGFHSKWLNEATSKIQPGIRPKAQTYSVLVRQRLTLKSSWKRYLSLVWVRYWVTKNAMSKEPLTPTPQQKSQHHI